MEGRRFLKPKKNVNDKELSEVISELSKTLVKFKINKLNLTQENKDIIYSVSVKLLNKIL